jgi:hypothetical protein
MGLQNKCGSFFYVPADVKIEKKKLYISKNRRMKNTYM